MTITEIQTLLSSSGPQADPGIIRPTAAVALVLREHRGELSVLFIERATYQDDPWSGNLGFPGGKVEAMDTSERMTAERETREELGLNLTTARYLGRLADICGEQRPIRVSCFVYGLEKAPPLTLSNEIKDAFWVPLTTLAAPERQITAQVSFGGETHSRPAVLLPQTDKPVLWGLTYRMVQQFLQLLSAKRL
jgi:8-oxo-dGTP pyrophosphatase MutT (NUDIX family)